MPHPLRERFKRGRVARGIASSLASPALVEFLGKGWDFVWIDAQHGEWTLATVGGAIRACALSGSAALVRVPGHDYSVLGPFADLAPEAMMIPMVDTPEQARQIVAGLRFPPVGNRSYGGRRVYDRYGPDYHLDPERLVVLAQVESPESVANAEAILAIDGIDGLFIGAADLRLRLGLPMQARVDETAELQRCFRQVAAAAKNTGKVSGCVVTDDGVMALSLELGMQVLAFGGDAGLMRRAVADKLADVRAVLP